MFFIDSGLSFDASPVEVIGEEDSALMSGGGRVGRRREQRAVRTVFGVYGCWKHFFTLLLFVVWILCYFIMFLVVLTLTLRTHCWMAT